MPEKQYARGIFGQFTPSERPFDVPNGMEDNLRLIDDHLGLYTLNGPTPPDTFAGGADGDGQIFTDGSYAVQNAGVVRSYPPRKGLRAVAVAGTESWLNTGSSWEQFSVVDTRPASARAEAAQAAAELARDAALIQAGVYVDEPTGRAAVGDGQAFKVQGSGDVAAREYRRLNASASEPIIAYPSIAAVDGIRAIFNAGKQALYTGAGPIYPTVATIRDGEIHVLEGIDVSTGLPVIAGSITTAVVVDTTNGQLQKLGQANYIGNGPLYPVATVYMGGQLHIVQAFDAESGTMLPNGGAPSAEEWPVPHAVNHALGYGQSNVVGAGGGTAISLAQPFSNLTFAGGPRADGGDFTGPVALVERDVVVAPDGGTGRTETPCSGAANYASKYAFLKWGVVPSDYVIFASTAGHGGYRLDELVKTAPWYQQLLMHVAAAKALFSDYACHTVEIVQGENNAIASQQTPFEAYYAALVGLQPDVENDVKGISGQKSGVWFSVAQISYSARTWKDVAIAQLRACQNNSKFYISTPMYHLPFTNDNVHLTPAGRKWLGCYQGRASAQLIHGKRKPDSLQIASAQLIGSTIKVRFRNVPTAPLVLDTTTLAATTNNGFRVVDASGTVPITSMAVANGVEVDIVLSAPPTGAAVLRYALDYASAGMNLTSGAAGNLRDSTTDAEVIDGVLRPLYHVCCHDEVPIISLGAI